jgi:hypothetical protein
MWVIIYHSLVSLWFGLRAISQKPDAYSAFDRAVAWLSVPTAFGGSAVMLCFLVSGFCIHLPDAANTRALDISRYVLAVVLACILERLVLASGGPTPTGL